MFYFPNVNQREPTSTDKEPLAFLAAIAAALITSGGGMYVARKNREAQAAQET